MSRFKYDYPTMERAYVAHDSKSVREVAKEHGVPESRISAVHAYAKKNGWAKKREDRKNQTNDRVVSRIAAVEAERTLRELEVKDNAVGLIDEAIASARESLKETHYVRELDDKGKNIFVERPKHPATVTSVVALIDRLDRLFGNKLLPASEGNGGTGSGIDVNQLLAGGNGAVDILALLARRVPRDAGQPEPRRVGAGAGRDPEAAGEV